MKRKASLVENVNNLIIADECGVCGGNNSICDLDILSTLIPEEYSIFGIYPNPFNPVTSILYSLPENAHVELVVYNIQGRQVKTLINDFQAAGYHNINWNASFYPSGVYLIRIYSGEFTQTKKIALIK